jgi:hypothetical protein
MFDIEGPFRKTEPSRFDAWVDFLRLVGTIVSAIVALFSLLG